MSNARRERRSNAALEAALDALNAAKDEASAAAKKADAQIKELKAELWRVEESARQDRLMRLSAQRGLVAYMREHGEEDKIGYDPDRDPDVIAAIRHGELPKPGLNLAPLMAESTVA